ncbi:unnamed protein product [Schistosoma turkestanicum]|nr:unnamed protein product [Schistosoma turkestanicum]
MLELISKKVEGRFPLNIESVSHLWGFNDTDHEDDDNEVDVIVQSSVIRTDDTDNNPLTSCHQTNEDLHNPYHHDNYKS